jgi:hypothetical protein
MGEGSQQGELAAGGTEAERNGVAEVVPREAATLGDDPLELGDQRVEPPGDGRRAVGS